MRKFEFYTTEYFKLIFNLKELNKDERASLSSIKGRLEIIRVKNKKTTVG